MTSKILRSILLAVVAVLLTSLAVVTGILYQYFGGIQQSQLKDELRLAVHATQRLGESYLGQFSSEHYRLTWIAADGAVLFDTWTDAYSMENHADREEFQEALAGGAGSSVRYSATLTEQTVYEAARLEDGSVLRISISRATAGMLVVGMLPPITMIAVLAILLSVWLARRMARRVVEPLNRLDLEHPLENDAYEELSPLLRRIHAQHQEIEQQMQALRRNREDFQQITNGMREALVLLDKRGWVISLNPAARSLFGAPADAVGKDFLELDRSPEMRLALREAKKAGHASFRAAVHNLEYQFDLSRIDSEGIARGLVILAFDVTEQVDAERTRREFSANVSHELKTPLQSIIGSAELLENGLVKPEDQPRFIGHIRKESARLVTLIDDIIRLSQLDEGVEMPREEVSLRVLADEVCDVLNEAADTKGVSLTVAGGDGIIIGVRRLLFEMLYNLCDNAIKYNTPGGTVRIAIEEAPDKVCLIVQDSGIGVAPEHQHKIFERFYRVDKSHSRQSGGTGLGLSIVRHAVQYHHGQIDLRSEVGKGTEITVTLERQG